MQCPNDQATLLMTERQGIEIDYCPTCRGVWLDKGELDKLIANSESSALPTNNAVIQKHYDEPQHHQDQRQNYSNDEYYPKKKRKKESFIGELFDF